MDNTVAHDIHSGGGVAIDPLKQIADKFQVFVEKELPDNNPKTAAGRAKPKFMAIPPAGLIYVGAVMELGRQKYGLYNWRDKPITASTYIDALFRHLLSYLDGEYTDPESGQPHLAHVASNAMILLDAKANGVLADDRTENFGVCPALIQEWASKEKSNV